MKMLKNCIDRLIFLLIFFIIFLISWTRQSAAQQPFQLWGWKEVPINFNITRDVDHDGIFDFRERILGTDPRSSDTDNDGFNDLFEENYRAFGFNPLKRTVDTDRDGLSDTFEKEWGTSPFNYDTDGDTLSDFDEVMNRQFGYDPVQYTKDTDFDGLADRLERAIGTSIDNPDSNDDNINDFRSFRAGFHPDVPITEENFSELVGTTYSSKMENALLEMQKGGRFPPELARELPFPAVTRRLYGTKSCDLLKSSSEEANTELTVSAALMQQSVGIDPSYSAGYPAVYPEYNKVVSFLIEVARNFDGSPNPNIVRLFRWSQRTEGDRYIYALKISDNPDLNEEDEPEMLLMGLHHGNELISASFTMELIRYITEQYAIGNNKEVNLSVNKCEIWIIPVVNPDGYTMAVGERGSGANVNWRKNIRKVPELGPHGYQQTELNKGVDPNRNYGFEHIRTFSPEQIRDKIDSKCYTNNGLDIFGEFDPATNTYAGIFAFSDVEARAVNFLANNAFYGSDEIDGFRCSLSWHTGLHGVVMYPMNHETTDGLTNADREEFDTLSNAVAVATGYFNFKDEYYSKYNGYEAFGTSDDWLYKNNGILAITVEAYSREEAKDDSGRSDYFPASGEIQQQVVDNNLKGAMQFIRTCGKFYSPIPFVDAN